MSRKNRATARAGRQLGEDQSAVVLIDGEVVPTRRATAFLYAFDLLELEGKDLSPRITNAQFTIARAGCRTVRASPLAKFIEPLTVC